MSPSYPAEDYGQEQIRLVQRGMDIAEARVALANAVHAVETMNTQLENARDALNQDKLGTAADQLALAAITGSAMKDQLDEILLADVGSRELQATVLAAVDVAVIVIEQVGTALGKIADKH
jgi:hypothetical protein